MRPVLPQAGAVATCQPPEDGSPGGRPHRPTPINPGSNLGISRSRARLAIRFSARGRSRRSCLRGCEHRPRPFALPSRIRELQTRILAVVVGVHDAVEGFLRILLGAVLALWGRYVDGEARVAPFLR